MKELHRHIRFALFSGLIFMFFSYFGTKFIIATMNLKKVSYTALDVLFPIIITIASSLVIYFLLNIKLKNKKDKTFNLKKWQIFLPLLLSSLVVFLACFPGHHPFDSSDMYQAFKSGNITTHYSPLITLIIGYFLSIGNNTNVGCAILIILQILFINLVLTAIIFYCSKRLEQKRFSIIFVIFFMLHPLVQVLIIRTGQDTIFSGLFALLCLEFLKLSEDENYFNKKSKIIYIMALVFCLCATRNNGLYALLPALIAAPFLVKNKKQILLTLLTPIVVFFGYNFILTHTFVAKESFYKETLNVPVIQIARAMYFNPDEGLKNELSVYFEEGCDSWAHAKMDWKTYIRIAGITDLYKGCLNTTEIEKDPAKFFSLWAKIGQKNPIEYFEAPWILMLGLYHPYAHSIPRSFYSWHPYVDSWSGEYDRNGVKQISLIPSVKNLLDGLIDDQVWYEIPVFRVLWSAPLSTYLCIIAIILVLYKRKYKYLLPLLFILGLILTVFLSPIALFRYSLPAIFCIPIMCYIIKSVLK